MYYVLLSLIGGLIAIMVTANGILSSLIGLVPSLAAIHISGLILSIITSLSEKAPEKKQKPALWLYTPGFLGILVVFCNILCVQSLGVSLTLSLGLLGQICGSLFIDITGFAGMKKRPLTLARIAGLLISASGCLLMLEITGTVNILVVPAFLAGTLTTVATTMNASLGTYIGVFHATLTNYITGLIGSLFLLFISGIPDASTIAFWLNQPWYYLAGGGLLGVFVVTGINRILPHVPVLYSTLILFTGEIAAGFLLDIFIDNTVSMRMLAGGIIILLGLSVNIWFRGISYNQGSEKNMIFSWKKK